MTGSEYRKCAYDLLSITVQFAPDATAQEVAARLFRECEKDWGPSEQLVREMSGVLHTGLAFGNWPWTKRK